MIAKDILGTYELTIGIECHVQLATKTKLFSSADNDARDKAPNSVVVPIDFGLPGMLPVLNKKAVELAVIAGKALNGTVANVSRFDRKHYFYPDLPKGYQTTQMYHPIIIGGSVEAPMPDGSTITVRIHHAHMEEDAGKQTHYSEYSLVDLNRAGTPLIEIVSEPDIHSAEAAKAYATELYRLMTYAGVTYGDLYHGNMRFDVNVSVAKKGASELGKRAEVKNLNSFRSVERAAEYEFYRQVELLEDGETITQETRGWDDALGKTSSQRSKEDAQDYRYMPDADIPPIVLSDEEIAEIQKDMPLLPSYYRDKWTSLDLDRSVIESLLATRAYASLITEIQKTAGDQLARRVAHWFSSAIDPEKTDEGTIHRLTSRSPDDFVELAEMVEKGELSSTTAKEIFNELLNEGRFTAREIAEQMNLLQISDEDTLAAIVDQVLQDPASAKSIEDIKAGQEKAIGYLVGQVMKKSGGSANPGLVQKIIKERVQ